MKKPRVGVIIVTYNSAKTIVGCLKSVSKLQYPDLEIIVIDNTSTDDTVKIISQQFKQISCIQNNNNIGFAQANNQGIEILQQKKCDYVLLLNPDTEVKETLIIELLIPFSHSEHVGVSGCAISYKKQQKIWYAGGSFNRLFCYTRHTKMNQSLSTLDTMIHDTDFITGCCMLIRTTIFEKIGLLDTKFQFYFEDAEFCLRARHAGFSSVVIEKTLVYHDVSSSAGEAGSNSLSPFKAYYFGRNPFLLLKKNAGILLLITGIWGQLCIRFPFHAFNMIRGHNWKSMAAYIRGMKDGIMQ